MKTIIIVAKKLEYVVDLYIKDSIWMNIHNSVSNSCRKYNVSIRSAAEKNISLPVWMPIWHSILHNNIKRYISSPHEFSDKRNIIKIKRYEKS